MALPRLTRAAALMAIAAAMSVCDAEDQLPAQITAAADALKAGQYEQVITSLAAEALAEQVAQSAPAQFYLGRAHESLEQWDQAAACFTKATELKADSAASWLGLGRVQERRGDVDAARAAYQQCLKLDPEQQDATDALQRLNEEAPAPAPGGRRVAVLDQGLGIGPATVRLDQPQVRDYTFTTAPTDWIPSGGIWQMTNRWACSPQFSWLGGWGEGKVCTWNKREFIGDIVVEFYAGMKMGFGNISSYKNPNDMNLTICGDGANVDSGYTFMFGGHRNTVTRIMKGEEILAETGDTKFLLPLFEDQSFGSYDFHRKWWGVRAVKRGGHLEMYIDNQLALTADDPEPLSRGRIAIWTRANGLIIARARVFHQQEADERTPIPGSDFVSQAAPAVPRLLFTSETHPGVFADFERDMGPWREVHAEPSAAAAILQRKPEAVNQPDLGDVDAQGAVLSLVPRGEAGRCLRLANRTGGGDFAAALDLGTFDPGQLRRIEFDYRLPPQVKVNLYVRVNGTLWEAQFTGLDRPAPQADWLGAFDDISADDAWHHAAFDLAGHLAEHYGAGTELQADALFFGNLNDEGYLRCGLGGNPAGSAWHVDNFALFSAGGSELKLAWSPTGEAKPAGYAVSVNEPLPEPPTATHTEPSLEATALRPGVNHILVRPQMDEQTWGPTEAFSLFVDGAGPGVAGLSPAHGSATGDPTIEIAFDEGRGVGVDPASVKIAVNGQEYAVAEHAAAEFDLVEQVARFSPQAAGLVFADGQQVDVSVQAADGLGHALASPAQWSFSMRYELDREPPVVAVAEPAAVLCYETFEEGLGEVEAASGSYARVTLDRTTAASGRQSVRVLNLQNGGNFGVTLRASAYDPGQYPVVSFDYKLGPRPRIDLVISSNVGTYSVRLTDTDCTYTRLADLSESVVADGQWHHLQLNLLELLRAAAPTASSYSVTALQLLDTNWTGNAQGSEYHLDNFALLRTLSGASPIPCRWQATDATGIAGVSWAVDASPYGTPPREAATAEPTFQLTDLKDGLQYLHVRCVDAAGNWGPPTHVPLLVDATPPVAHTISPAAGPGAHSLVELALTDSGGAGINPASIKLSVGGAEYGVDSPGLTFDSEQGRLTWNCEQMSPPVVLADQQAVEVKLLSAQDFAGNAVAAPPAWAWTMNYAQDTTPPTLRGVSTSPHRTFLADTFEETLNQWANRVSGKGAVVERDTTTAAGGQASVKLTNEVAGGYMQARVTATPFDAAEYPYVTFWYKIPPGVTLDLMFNMSGWRAVKLTDDSAGALLEIPNVQADDQWHRCSFNLAEVLRKVQDEGALTVTEVIVSDRNEVQNPAGAVAHFDDFVIGQVGTGTATVQWTCTDTTGIQGYSYVVDQQPGTVPATTVNLQQPSLQVGELPNGLNFVHVRPLDGAGHWGPTQHVTLIHGEVPTAK